MEEIIKVLNIKLDMDKKEIYNLLKTNSQKVNSEIAKKLNLSIRVMISLIIILNKHHYSKY